MTIDIQLARTIDAPAVLVLLAEHGMQGTVCDGGSRVEVVGASGEVGHALDATQLPLRPVRLDDQTYALIPPIS